MARYYRLHIQTGRDNEEGRGEEGWSNRQLALELCGTGYR